MSRELVEKFLGSLEGQGYLADRLETAHPGRVAGHPVTADGAYIYPDRETGKFSALVAWWYGGRCIIFGLLHVPAVEGRDACSANNSRKWPGRANWKAGWKVHRAGIWWRMKRPPQTGSRCSPLAGQSVDVLPPLAEAQLAASNANRAARSDFKSGILPVEYALRYRQEFVDRLWMRSVARYWRCTSSA